MQSGSQVRVRTRVKVESGLKSKSGLQVQLRVGVCVRVEVQIQTRVRVWVGVQIQVRIKVKVKVGFWIEILVQGRFLDPIQTRTWARMHGAFSAIEELLVVLHSEILKKYPSVFLAFPRH